MGRSFVVFATTDEGMDSVVAPAQSARENSEPSRQNRIKSALKLRCSRSEFLKSFNAWTPHGEWRSTQSSQQKRKQETQQVRKRHRPAISAYRRHRIRPRCRKPQPSSLSEGRKPTGGQEERRAATGSGGRRGFCLEDSEWRVLFDLFRARGCGVD